MMTEMPNVQEGDRLEVSYEKEQMCSDKKSLRTQIVEVVDIEPHTGLSWGEDTVEIRTVGADGETTQNRGLVGVQPFSGKLYIGPKSPSFLPEEEVQEIRTK